MEQFGMVVRSRTRDEAMPKQGASELALSVETSDLMAEFSKTMAKQQAVNTAFKKWSAALTKNAPPSQEKIDVTQFDFASFEVLLADAEAVISSPQLNFEQLAELIKILDGSSKDMQDLLNSTPLSTPPAFNVTLAKLIARVNVAIEATHAKARGANLRAWLKDFAVKYAPPGESVDKESHSTDDENMSAPTREEFDAKLETIEARMDGRVASIVAKLDANLARMDERDKRYDVQFAAMAENARETKAALSESAKDTKSAISNLKTTTIVTAIGAVLTIVLGVAAFNATVLSNMVASFESGKNTAASIVQATEQLKQTQEQLKAIQEQLSKPRAPDPKS